jgi:hypothetical protein
VLTHRSVSIRQRVLAAGHERIVPRGKLFPMARHMHAGAEEGT